MKPPRIGFQTIKAVARVICGDVAHGDVREKLSPYRTGKLLDEFT